MAAATAWDAGADRSVRVAVVTGANTGIGWETARALAARAATVVLACRNRSAAERAARDITASVPGSQVHVVTLDLADSASIAACAQQLRARWPVIDLLINNAGVMAHAPGRTVDGFETDFGTNFLGPFALTAQLVESVAAAPAGRVVTVSSITHRIRAATLDLADPHFRTQPFDTTTAYARSKLAAVTFMLELQRRLAAAGSSTISVGAHPGGVRTNILSHQNRAIRWVYHPRMARLTGWFTQSPADGARPILRAALDPALRGGEFFGPGGRWDLVGAPVPVRTARRAQDPEVGARLWARAQEWTGVEFRIPAG